MQGVLLARAEEISEVGSFVGSCFSINSCETKGMARIRINLNHNKIIVVMVYVNIDRIYP